MSSPINDVSHSIASSTASSLTPRQRLENVLSHLPIVPGSLVSQLQEPGAKPATEAEALVEPIQRINKVMRSYGVEFDLNRQDGRVVTRVVDRASGDVIRQIPNEEVLRIAESLEQMQGRLIELKA